MPWTEWTIMDQREQFIRDYLSGDYAKGALCAAYGISRPTGDKWLTRYHAQGVAGLADLARRPDALVEAIIGRKHRHPSFAPKKIRNRLRAVAPGAAWPVDSTVGGDLESGGVGAAPAGAAAGSGGPTPPEPRDGGGLDLECGLQGRFCVGHRAEVLSADGDGSGKPVSVAVSGAAHAHDGGGAPVVYLALSRIWAAGDDADGQWPAVCVDGLRGAEPVSGLVGPVGDSAGHPERERRARADASDPESGDRGPGSEPRSATTAVGRVCGGI